ncbi:protein pxr1-like [Pitangus sulphuratus]|nr:protein pxr1-like [Pitangus sulphuratus]
MDCQLFQDNAMGDGTVSKGFDEVQPMVKTWVEQAVPLQLVEDPQGVEIYLQPVEEPMLEQVDVRRRL